MPVPRQAPPGAGDVPSSSTTAASESAAPSAAPTASLLQSIDPHHYAAKRRDEADHVDASQGGGRGGRSKHAVRFAADGSPSPTAAAVAVAPSSAVVTTAPPQLTLTQRALQEASSGLGGAIFSAFCVYPLDLVKTRLQLPNCPYTSLTDGMVQIIREEGLLTLYTGLSSELLKTSVQNFSYFYWYILLKEWVLTRLNSGRRAQPVVQQNALGLATHHELAQHQALCTDDACFCRSVGHLAAHSEAHKQRVNQLDQWRRNSFRRRQSVARRVAATAAHDFDTNAFHPRLMASVSEPHLVGLVQGDHDIDDAPYVDVKDADQTTLVTHTATVLPSAAAPLPPQQPQSPSSPSPPAAEPPRQLSIGASLVMGTLAGCVTQLVVNPISVIQTRMMTQKRGGGSAGFWSIASSILREEGLGAFFAGILPGFILSTNPSIQFLVFDRLKALILRILSQSMTPRTLSIFESFVLGAFSKIVATLVTYPYIFARVRLMVKHDASGAPAVVYKGTLDVIFRTLKYEGFTGLFTGLQAQLLKSVLGSALMFMAKEKLVVIIAYVVSTFHRMLEKYHAQTKAIPPPSPSTSTQRQ